ncbi:MAG TPA: dephospho-CoA kinase [Bacteroidaceae bacterium]|nr:dephospho-CoA kinase [Bacteroidaceae bacterium]
MKKNMLSDHIIVVGITGGIGSGKSVVSRLFCMKNIPVYDADTEAKRLMNVQVSLREQLCNLLDEDLYVQGELDKARLAKWMFADNARVLAVNKIVHGALAQDFIQWVNIQYQLGLPIVAIESAILFESGFNTLVDLVILVDAPKELRLQRAMMRDSVTREQVEVRMNKQMDDDARRELVDKIILCDDIHPVIPQVSNLVTEIQQYFTRK